MIVASAMDSPSCGIMSGIEGMSRRWSGGVMEWWSDGFSGSLSEEVAGCGRDAARGGPMGRPKGWMIGDRRIFCVQTLRRRIEQPEPFTGDASNHLGSDPSPWERFA